MANQSTDGKTAKKTRPLYNQGEERKFVDALVGVEAGWSDGDTVILAYNLPIDTIVSRINLPSGSPAITGATDYDIGFYEPADADGQGLGDVLDKDVLADGVSFASARNNALDILGSGVTLDKTKTIGELLSLTSENAPAGGVHLVLTLNTAGSGAGDIDFEIALSPAH